MHDLPDIKKKARKPAYKKPDTVRELERLANEAARKKYPSLKPEYLAPRKYVDNTANGLTACIVSYITLCGGFASRLNSTGVYRQKLGKYTTGTQKRGIPDVIGTYKGKSLFVEVKIKDAQSEAQKKVQAEHEASGGLYFLAHNFTEFKAWFDSI